MKNTGLTRGILRAVYRYLLFFMLVAFVTTCCMVLFVTTLTQSINIELTPENLGKAAKLTFANVLLLSLIFSVIDALRRKLTIERPVKKIVEGANKIMQGDFSVRIGKGKKLASDETFDEIIDKFNEMASELGSLEMLRSDFISSVSHEMKTPLAVMQNYGVLLASDDLSDDQRIEYAHAITERSKRMSEMITNILRLNRLENQQIYPKKDKFDLGEQLGECIIQYETLWENGEIELETDIDDDVRICADAELLELVWNNLLSNAFKFTQSGGRVSVSMHEAGGIATVSVSDTGCGMTPEVGARIFEKFYQGDTSHSTRGNGLGLALVKRVVDILHGEISVESRVGKGSTFTVKISTR